MKLQRTTKTLFLFGLLNFAWGCVALVPLIEPDRQAERASGPEPSCTSPRASRSHRSRDPIPGLVRQLETGDAAARTRAATTLGEYPTRVNDTIEPLARATEDSSKNVRRAAVKALARLKDARSVAPIRQRLKDPDPFVRESARNALRQLNVRSS